MYIIYIQSTDIDYNLETVQNSSTILSVPTPIHWSAPLDVEGSEKVDSSFRGLTLRLAQRGCHLAWIYFVSWQKMKKMMGHGKAHGYFWIALAFAMSFSFFFWCDQKKALILLHLGWCWKSKGPMLLDTSGSLVAIREHRTHFLGFTWQAFYVL